MLAWFAHHVVGLYAVLAAVVVAGIAQCELLIVAVPAALLAVALMGYRWKN